MIRLALAFILAGTAAHAQPFPEYQQSGAPDELLLERLGEDRATLTYSNSADHTSKVGRFEMSHDGLAVTARVSPQGAEHQMAELLTVDVPEGWVAIPAEVYVLDGEVSVVHILRGEHLGY